MEIISREGYRIDGRKPNEPREVHIKTGNTNNKIYVELTQGLSKVKCTINGPKEKERSKESLKIKVFFYDVSRQEIAKKDKKAEEIELFIFEIFNSLILHGENMFIEAEIIIKQDDGSLNSVIINCMSLALCYSGIQMIDLCVSSTNSFLNDVFIHDLCGSEQSVRLPLMIVGYLSHKKSIFYMKCIGKIKEEMFESLCGTSKKHCEDLFKVFYSFLKNEGINISNKLNIY